MTVLRQHRSRKNHRGYRELIKRLPTFEKGDRFKMNIVSCAMLSAFVLNMPKRPTVEELTRYYAAAMMIGPLRRQLRLLRPMRRGQWGHRD